MPCGFSMRYGLRVLKRPQSETNKIFGTWDFKWPAGTTIRVAFQQLSAKDETDAGMPFADLVQKVATYARRWPQAYEAKYGACPVDFEFLPNFLPAPGPKADGGRSKSDKSGGLVDYDVLVSLAPLPFDTSYSVKLPTSPRLAGAQPGGKPRPWPTKDIDRTEDGKPLQVSLPTSELGRFAVRCDYGVPTVYVGRPTPDLTVQNKAKKLLSSGPGYNLLVGGAGPTSGLADYFGLADEQSASGQFEATIVHEFGHVLGIPHLHQSPLDRPRWRTIEDIISILAAETGLDFDEDAVRAQLTLPFPSTQSARGEVLYSDWGPVPRDENGDPQIFHAAMVHPLLGNLVLPATNKKQLPPAKWQTSPQAVDLEFLHRMYS